MSKFLFFFSCTRETDATSSRLGIAQSIEIIGRWLLSIWLVHLDFTGCCLTPYFILSLTSPSKSAVFCLLVHRCVLLMCDAFCSVWDTDRVYRLARASLRCQGTIVLTVSSLQTISLHHLLVSPRPPEAARFLCTACVFCHSSPVQACGQAFILYRKCIGSSISVTVAD